MDIETELELFDNQVKESDMELLRAGLAIPPIRASVHRNAAGAEPKQAESKRPGIN